MTLASLTGVLWRQRWLVLPAMLIALLMCMAVAFTSPPTYRATASVVLLNPPALPQIEFGGPTIPADWQNPYSRVGDLSVIVDLMGRVMESDEVADELAAAGFDGTAEVAGNRGYYNGPIVDLASEASSEEQAIANINILMVALDQHLEQLQEATADTYRIRAEAIDSPTEATAVFSKTLRLLIVTAALGGILVVGTALVSDRLRSRAKTKSAHDESAHDDSDGGISESVAQSNALADATSGTTPHVNPQAGPEPADLIDSADDFLQAAEEGIDLSAAGATGSRRQPLNQG